MATTAQIVTIDLARSCEQLQRDEGFQQFPYIDPLRKRRVEQMLSAVGVTFEQFMQIARLTIGNGFNLQSDGISADESRLVLQQRVWKRYLALITALPWVKFIDEARQGVLLNMAYNMGVTDLITFTTFISLVQSGQYDKAADDMKQTAWYREVGDRAVRLEQQMRTGVWQ